MGRINSLEIFRARKRIAPYIHKTPLLPSLSLCASLGKRVYLKMDMLQETGSFKVRGAANFISHLSSKERERGVVAYSTGNHGKAVAYMAKRMGCKAKICLSSLVPENKRRGIEELGGEVVISGQAQDEAKERAKELEEEEGLSLVPPFDDPLIISGQGTMGLEIIEERPEVEALLVPLSGGGLLGGVAQVVKRISPQCRIYGISMERGAAMHASQKAGCPVLVEEESTLADSLQGGILLDNQYTFSLVREHVDDLFLVTEEEIERALWWFFFQENLILEGAAVVGAAALLSPRYSFKEKEMALILSGRNIDGKLLIDVVGRERRAKGEIVDDL